MNDLGERWATDRGLGISIRLLNNVVLGIPSYVVKILHVVVYGKLRKLIRNSFIYIGTS